MFTGLVAGVGRLASRTPVGGDVRLRIEEFPDEDMLDELQIDDAFDLTGLYDGIPLTENMADLVAFMADFKKANG